MIKFTIPFRLPSLNEYIRDCRCNKYAAAKKKRDIEHDIIKCLMTTSFKITAPVHITFIWHEPNKRRDKDNVAFGKKFILDALQTAGRLENDNNTFIAGFSDVFKYDKTARVEVIISETATYFPDKKD